MNRRASATTFAWWVCVWISCAGFLTATDLKKTDHWAFRPPIRPELPNVKRDDWSRGAVDRFVLARLEREGLVPSPEADHITLLRRLSLDLIGLPPSLEEADSFLADTRPDAYERLVDRLLASPHYGERWARYWLDAARYADSDGFEKDKPRSVWFYRDWVIDAHNRDLPYDEFVIEQIAGDLLQVADPSDAGQSRRVATGFLRNSMVNEEGGADPEQFRMEAMFDRMDAIGKSILGLTIQCSQCHDHKFDPVSQIDYYRLFAYLNNDHDAMAVVYTPDEMKRRAEVLRRIDVIEGELKRLHPDWVREMNAWESSLPDLPAWTVLRPHVDEISTGGQKYLPQKDGSFLAQSYAPTKHTARLTVRTDRQEISGFRLELMTDPNLPLRGPGRSILGTCALTEFEIYAAPASEPGKRRKLAIARATADINLAPAPLGKMFDDRSGKKRVTGPIDYAIDGNGDTAWGMDIGPGRRNVPRQAVFALAKPLSHASGTILTFHLKQNHGGWNSDDNQTNNLGRFRLSLTTSPDPCADTVGRGVRDILDRPEGRRSHRDNDMIFHEWRKTVSEWSHANSEIEAAWTNHPAGQSQLVLEAREKMRTTSVLKRGDFLRPTESVRPGTPAFLHPLPEGDPTSRLTFARWLVDRRSPTTARALVNRVWQAYFGRGLVLSSEDLGTQCEPPSHPALLDWLAVEFMQRGWSLKELHRTIVRSATYRQNSRPSETLLDRDPYNRLLARGARMRVEAEVVRDIMLHASGLLRYEIGGRSVFPPLPAFMLGPPVSYGPKIWPEDRGAQRYRRALYTFRYRSIPYPALQAFDAPNGDFSCVRRSQSNTPLQALVTLNEPLSLECARAMASRVLRDVEMGDDARLSYAFRLCVTRAPDTFERDEIRSLLSKQRLEYRRDIKAARSLLAIGAENSDEKSGVAELAAWTIIMRTLLNLHETISKE